MADPDLDPWAAWLLQRRYGGDPEELRRQLGFLGPIRDRVLANAALAEGETLLDVGTGDGLIAFGALDRVGPRGQVIFSDVSQDLLDHSWGLAERMGVADRCRFVRAAAEDLSPIAAAVDVVTARSVLIYVPAKERAFAEFHRVLRPGGRLSLFEPINRFGYQEPPDRFWGFDVGPVREIAARVRALYQARQPLDGDPMMDFDERDLLTLAERAGFRERHLEFRVDIEPHEPRPWATFAGMAFNPRIPTLAEAMAETLEPDESERFAAHLAPLVERGEGAFALAVAYLWARKQ